MRSLPCEVLVGRRDALHQGVEAVARLRRGPAHQEGELLAAVPAGEFVRVHATGEQAGRGQQHAVPHLVAMRVVDLLEVVEVDHGQGEPGATSLGLPQPFADGEVECPAVGDAREGVGGGLGPRADEVLLERVHAAQQLVVLSRLGGPAGLDGLLQGPDLAGERPLQLADVLDFHHPLELGRGTDQVGLELLRVAAHAVQHFPQHADQVDEFRLAVRPGLPGLIEETVDFEHDLPRQPNDAVRILLAPQLVAPLLDTGAKRVRIGRFFVGTVFRQQSEEAVGEREQGFGPAGIRRAVEGELDDLGRHRATST